MLDYLGQNYIFKDAPNKEIKSKLVLQTETEDWAYQATK